MRLELPAVDWLLVSLLVDVVLAHVVVAGVDGDAVMDDAIRDCIGGGVATER